MFGVLITPRVGFIAAKFIAPTRTSQSVYLEKTALRENFNAELEEKKRDIHKEVRKDRPQPSVEVDWEFGEKVDVLLLCFFAVMLTTVAFLKFFRSDV